MAMMDTKIRRILLLGKTGVGKSATGNTILRRNEFESTSDFSSVTRQCLKGSTVVAEWDITVVDTPDYFYATHASEMQDVRAEIKKGLSLCSPGAHAFLLLFAVGTFTEQENDVVREFKKIFGFEATKYTIVVFTHGDELCGTAMDKLIEKNEYVRDLLNQCGGRYHVINNEERNNLCQVTELLKTVDRMVFQNGGSFYTINMLCRAALKQKWKLFVGVAIISGILGGVVGVVAGKEGMMAVSAIGILMAVYMAFLKPKRKGNDQTWKWYVGAAMASGILGCVVGIVARLS